jgi:ATP-dependent RNA helicase RhlE
MLDMGFIPDIRRILAVLPPRRQNLLFSATFAPEIKKLSDTLLDNPVVVEVARRNSAAETVSQKVYLVEEKRKREVLAHLIRSQNMEQVLVFTRTKLAAERLYRQLEREQLKAAAIHGDKNQTQRTQALEDFKNGAIRVLVATDVAARGLDIEQLPHVVNYELPHVAEDYVHRIGRTGRAGATGEAISLVSPEESKFLADIEHLLKRELPRETAPTVLRAPAHRPASRIESAFDEPYVPAPASTHERAPAPPAARQKAPLAALLGGIPCKPAAGPNQ